MMEFQLPKPGHRIGSKVDETGNGFVTINPANEEVICELPEADEETVNKAVETAALCFENSWSQMSIGKRQHLLNAFAEKIKDKLDQFAFLESLENGVPISIVKRFSAAALHKNLSYYASWVDKISSEVVPIASSNVFDYTLKEPYGVAAILTAYNTPSLFLGSKAGPALAAGNTVIIKPSPFASLGALLFADLALEAGLPEGTVNVVLGKANTGQLLVSHLQINKISFTGSRYAGMEVSRLASKNLTNVSLDAIDKVAFGSALGAFALSGQACVAASRMYVQSSIKDQVIEKLKNNLAFLKIGDPMSPDSVLGPLISDEHRQKVETVIVEAGNRGAEILLEAKRPESNKGYYLSPALLFNASESDPLMREEVFGPVSIINEFETEEEIIKKANDTDFGLAAGIWTSDISRAHRLASKIRAGTVWINNYGSVPYTSPFGGYKKSGYGREGGHWGVEEFLQVKNVYIDLG
jgi:acyl-CoA reductase-like NAD-dependent aldehyde dehydrogenase